MCLAGVVEVIVERFDDWKFYLMLLGEVIGSSPINLAACVYNII